MVGMGGSDRSARYARRNLAGHGMEPTLL